MLIVDFLKAVQIKNDEAQGQAIAPRAVQFFFEGLAEARDGR